MGKFRGFRLGRRTVRIFRWTIRPCKQPARLFSLKCRSFRSFINPISKITTLARKLQRCSNRDYIRLGQAITTVDVPKGHLVVYVGELNGDTRREVVPAIYFNHPLFGELLKDAERVYGYNHPGGIKIPCGFSEFEKVKMRIAAWDNCNSNKGKHHKHW